MDVFFLWNLTAGDGDLPTGLQEGTGRDTLTGPRRPDMISATETMLCPVRLQSCDA